MRKQSYLRIRRFQRVTKGFLVIILLAVAIIIKLKGI